MPLTLYVPNEYGYVLLAGSSTFFVNFYQAYLVMKFRRASGIKYPNAYATLEQAEKDPKAFNFNCAQRAHGNFLETQPTVLGALLISGLRHPLVAAGLGAGWSASRVAYAVGYTSGDPRGRLVGSYASSAISILLAFLAAYTSATIILDY